MSHLCKVARCAVSNKQPAVYKDKNGLVYRIACNMSGCVVAASKDAEKGDYLIKKWNAMYGRQIQ